MRLIDADALWKAITEFAKSKGDCPLHIAEIYQFIYEAPTINTPIVNDMKHSVIAGENMCSYDEAFTIAEMLEETGLCKKCKLNCPNAGKSESERTDAI